MAPSQIQPSPQNALAALKQVDGAGSGLDADTLQGLTPAQLVTSGGGSGLVVLDANGVLVGPVASLPVGDEWTFGTGAAVVTCDMGDSLLSFLTGRGGFIEQGPVALSYESDDCTGARLYVDDPQFMTTGLLPRVLVNGTTGYHLTGAQGTHPIASSQIPVGTPGACSTAVLPFCASTTLQPPNLCCCSRNPPIDQLAADVATLDLAGLGLVAPFRIAGPPEGS